MATNFFPSRKRCCPECSTRTLTINDQQVTEYYHRGVVCHLAGHELALPLDVEMLRPGEGEETAAKRLLERVFVNYPRFFDIVTGDALYFNAPFINLCRAHHKHAIVVIKGDERLLLQDAQGLFAQRPPVTCQVGRRTLQTWDEEGFTSCEGVERPLRVVHTQETVARRQRIAGQWQTQEETSSWYWATTLSKNQFSTLGVCRGGHARWDVENDAFNTLDTHFGLDHCYKHAPQAIVNFMLTLFLAYALLQCFWRRNIKPALRKAIATMIGLTDELRQSLGASPRAPWYSQLAKPP